MSELPSGWTHCSLEDCVEILDSLRIPINNSERQQRIEGKATDQLYPYYGATGQVGLIDSFLFDEELVALGEDGVPFFDPMKSKAYMLHGKTWVNNHAHVLRGLNSIVTNKLVLYYLNQFDYQGFVNGGTRLKLTQASMRAIPVTLPPLAEQIRITQKLDELLAQVDTLKARIDAIPALLKGFRQSVLAAAVSGRLTEEWRKDADQIFDWKETSIDSICESSFYGPRFGKEDYVTDGIPTIRTTDMTSKGEIFITNETPRVNVPKEKIDQFKSNHGDLLITRTGSIGTMAIFRGKYDAIPSAYLIRFRFKSTVSVDFIYTFLTSPFGQEKLGLGTTTTTQPNINAQTIRGIKLQLPSVEEQNEIVRRVEQLFAFSDQLEAKVASAKSRIDHLTQSILAKAFRGELVPQDPNDEPASVLLERIKVQRVAEPKAKRGRKASV